MTNHNLKEATHPTICFQENVLFRHTQTKSRLCIRRALPSTSIPLGTNGMEPVAMMMFFAVITLSVKPTFPYLTF